MKHKSLIHIFCLFFIFKAATSKAEISSQEKIGQFSWGDLFLRPTYFSTEKNGGEFSLQDSSVSLTWQQSSEFQTYFRLGSTRQRGLTQIYKKDQPQDEFGFIEAYADYAWLYGRLRAGLIPLGFGLEGLRKDHDKIWPENLLLTERIITRRDFGLSYYSEHNQFFTELIIHNGEIDQSENDGNPWLSARWGWRGSDITAQFSGQAGSTKAFSTKDNGSPTIGNWQVSQNAEWRFFNFALYWQPRRWQIQMQSTLGEVEQGLSEKNFTHHQIDALRFFGDLGLGLKFENLDLNTKVKNDQQFDCGALVAYKQKDATSLFTVTYLKKVEERIQENNDEVWLQWRITAFAYSN